MKTFFYPAIALMNRIGYHQKFALLWLMCLAAIIVLVYNLFVSLSQVIRISQLELDGIVLSKPILQFAQLIQQHRALTALHHGSNKAAGIQHDAGEQIAFDSMEKQFPASLKESSDWKNIKGSWANFRREESGLKTADVIAARTRLIKQLYSFAVYVADQYQITLDPEIDTYYLLDTALIKLPDTIEHLGQLGIYGTKILTRKQVTEPDKVAVYGILAKLYASNNTLGANLEKVRRDNPAINTSLVTAFKDVFDAERQIAKLVSTNILTGKFAISPVGLHDMIQAVMGSGYTLLHSSLLPMADQLIKKRIAQAKHRLYVSMGFAVLVMLAVAYFTIGIYFSTLGSIQALARSSRAFAAGNLRERVHLDTHDELAQVGRSFNEMADGFNALLEARHQTEDSLKQFKNTLDQTHDCVFMFAPGNLKFIYANRGAVAQVGYSAKEMQELTPLDIKPEFTWESFCQMLQPMLDGRQTAITFETVHRHKDGHLIPVEVVLQYIHQDDAAPRFVAIVRDINERKQTEQELGRRYEELKALNAQLQETQNQLLQSEKMASVGQLAAGVAHEINNPIGYVYSNLGTLEKYVQDMFAMLDAYQQTESAIGDGEAVAGLRAAKQKFGLEYLREDVPALMNESKDGITRVKKIVQDLKDFSHVEASEEWHWVNLHKGLDSTLNIVNNEIKYKAVVVKEYGILPEVECLSSQLNQVFLNMLVNASHAIEERGTITIRTGSTAEEVWVEIADTGKGIAPENFKKIFDPFFTTKPVGQGTGLGLSLSYGIIQKHHGRIEVKSEVGKGTTFRVWLPIRQPPADVV